MKWSDRIAQGFNPGLDGEKRALPVRRSLWGSRDEGGKVAPNVRTRLVDRRANNLKTRFGGHFQGDLTTSNPGLSDHFMVVMQAEVVSR
jgi:hypothetical protein